MVPGQVHMRSSYLFCVYVDDVVRQRLERVQTSILAEGHYQVEIDMNILWILCMLWLYPFIHPHDFEICNSRLSYLKSIYCISLYYRTSSTEKAGLLMGNHPRARSCSTIEIFFLSGLTSSLQPRRFNHLGNGTVCTLNQAPVNTNNLKVAVFWTIWVGATNNIYGN